MANLIVIRLHPTAPVDGPTFTGYLSNLVIKAVALTYADPSYTPGEPATGEADYHPLDAGTMTGIEADNPLVPLPNYTSAPPPAAYAGGTGIAQHFETQTVGLLTYYFPVAAGTAVIEVDVPPWQATFDNLHLVITRGAETIQADSDYYVVPLGPGPMPGPDGFQGLQTTSFYLSIPAPPAANGVGLTLPADGSPPPFDQLLSAVQSVLGIDPGGALPDLTKLTAAECSNIAYEIIWSRQDPLPTPPEPIDQLYNNPPNTGTPSDTHEQDRKQFEGTLANYYATRNALAQRLSGFVFALASACAEEQQSLAQTQAIFSFSANPLTTPPAGPALLVITGLGGGDPANNSLGVPAGYFYALGANLPTAIHADRRFTMAAGDTPDNIEAALLAAYDIGTITDSEPFVTSAAATIVNPAQAARRLSALAVSAFTTTGRAPLTAELQPVLTDWLKFPPSPPLPATPTWPTYKASDDDTIFWPAEAAGAGQPTSFLDWVLAELTRGYVCPDGQLLADKIAAALPAQNIGALAAFTTAQWQTFLTQLLAANANNLAYLPPFTGPGNAEARISAFIQAVSVLFEVAPPATPTGYTTGAPDAPPTLAMPSTDWIGRCLAIYQTLPGGSVVVFGNGFDATVMRTAAAQVFPGDAEAQTWLVWAITAIDALHKLAFSPLVVIVAPQVDTPQLRFSIMEALYARGFTGAHDIGPLTLDSFEQALIGTVAFAYAAQLYQAAGAVGPVAPPAGPPTPVNPDGCLTNCVPPPCLSPFGPTAYLCELLQLAETATCEDPKAPPAAGHMTLGEAVAARRGPISTMLADCANCETPLPLIDLANECLENVASTLPAAPVGAIYNTATDTLADHKLCEEQHCTPDPAPDADDCHDPAVLFGAMAQYSSPAVPTAQQGAYDKLKTDFSAPSLPYSQPLDIDRSYLCHLGTDRAHTMRTFRRWITEFALDPSLPVTTFQANLWRFPLRLEIAVETVGLTPEEFAAMFSGTGPAAWTLYGFGVAEVGEQSWTQIVVTVCEFLARTGLTWCEFLELWRCGPLKFRNAASRDGSFPPCEPCYTDRLTIGFGDIDDIQAPLLELVIFIRLWRALQRGCCGGHGLTFCQLADISTVLLPITGGMNAEFVRQLAAILLLHDPFCMPFAEKREAAPGATGSARMQLLALWVGSADPAWGWAVAKLIEHVGEFARREHHCRKRPPEFVKLLVDNLDPLSRLAGFDPASATDTWRARPTHTLRFAEVLAKIYASDFGIGEILYLFSADRHLDGDDPFPLQERNDALDFPLGLPEHLPDLGLWELRERLLRAEDEIDDAAAGRWTWPSIVESLQDEFGYVPAATNDPLQSLGAHFFPGMASGTGAQYRVSLSGSTAALWNAPPDGPFQYDAVAGELSTRLPLRDGAVIERLERMRQLTPAEAQAVQDLYFAPRLDLAPFAFLFPDFADAERHLIEERHEEARWDYFRRHFALAHMRCSMIAAHLARHVAAATCQPEPEGEAAAWKVLRSLFADSNMPAAGKAWEDDTGVVPPVTWQPPPSGSAFAALLGLLGTGLVGEFRDPTRTLVWREIRARTVAFTHRGNEASTPLPTVMPPMDLTLPAGDLHFISLRNGYALRDHDGVPLGGASGFAVRWTGVLLIDGGGEYSFLAGAPTPEGRRPDFERAEHRHWRVTLARGQKTWIVLNHQWPNEEEGEVSRLFLRPGAYRITIEFQEEQPDFRRPEDIHHRHTGFELKYRLPGSEEYEVIRLRHLYRDAADAPLSQGIAFPEGSRAKLFLDGLYSSSLRDVRRSYQRAFKALLFVHRFTLSARPLHHDRQSELGYILANPDAFKGMSYYRPGGGANPFVAHAADFDFNLLPLRDHYLEPTSAEDDRTHPSAQREQALFDWWERIFDYVRMREATRARRRRPAWLLFEETATEMPADPTPLLRHIGVDFRHAAALLHYFDDAGPTIFVVGSGELIDDRWAVRVWHADSWMRRLVACFRPKDVTTARPCLWAADDPSLVLSGESGNANLVAFVGDGCIEVGAPRRYADLRGLNDGFRVRARDALVAFLCHMDRVKLPWTSSAFAQRPRDLTDVLLIDVEAGVCERASRIDEAITAVQSFIRRARLGLEPGWTIDAAFAHLWERDFGSFRLWQRCRQHTLYKENWIEWEDLEHARRIEAFRFLESELQRSALTVAVPGGLEWWPDLRPPAHPGLPVEQVIEPSELRRLEYQNQPGREGLDILGRQERHARPFWLAPLWHADGGGGQAPTPAPTPPSVPGVAAVHDALAPPPASNPGGPLSPADLPKNLPFWIEAAMRLGKRFWRIAAAGEPLAASGFAPHHIHAPCCCVDCAPQPDPLLDEFYFWLVDAAIYDVPTQNGTLAGLAGGSQTANSNGLQYGYQDAYYSQSDQQAELWQDPDVLPQLLDWKPVPAVRLAWCRVHAGEFQEPRQSDKPVLVMAFDQADLVFQGRSFDSLTFSVIAAVPPFAAYTDPSLPGFRYDMAADEAVVLPELVQAKTPAEVLPGGLPVYPYFAYDTPGARLFPYALFSPAIAIGETLRAHCNFEAALRWFRLAFDMLNNDCTWVSCPKDEQQPPTEVPVTADGAPASVDRSPPRDEHGCCQSTGVTKEVARNRSILLHALETMRDWADALMRRNTPEHIQQARLLVDTIALVLGRHPRVVDTCCTTAAPPLSGFEPAFAPLNPRLMDLYDVVDDRRALIHACIDARRLRTGRIDCDFSYFGDDPLREGWRESTEICAEQSEWCHLTSPYRFTYLIVKAQELAAKVSQFGAQLLAAYEKGDAEYLASLRQVHDREIMELSIAMRQEEWRESDWQILALQQGKAINQINQKYYQTLLDNDLIENERQYESLTEASIATRAAGNAVQAVGQIMKLIPDLFVGFPCEETWVPLGTKLAGVFESAGTIIDIIADVESGTAGLDLTEASWDRRRAEWQNQENMLLVSIEQNEMQILAAQRQRAQHFLGLNLQRRQGEQASEVLDFLRDKFTAHDLYLFLQKETADLHFRMYELALHAARQAEHAFNFERGHTTRRFVPNDAWNRLREGLTAGERLELTLRRMEQAYMDENVREYELTKHFSLRLDFPLAYLELRLTGACEIEIPEWRFDAETPGMYMRRIRNVSVTIPCVAGPFAGVFCRLTLLSSMTRIDPRLIPLPGDCCCDEECANAYSIRRGDHRIVRMQGARESIATSSGQNDSGLFELNFHDDRYLPFEFQGAVSRWRIEMPQEDNYFDFDTLTDFVFHLNFTAREGGDLLRKAAREIAECHQPGNGWCLFNVRHDFPEAWQQFRMERRRESKEERRDRILLPLTRNMFPFVPGAEEIVVTGILIMFEANEEAERGWHELEVAVQERDQDDDDCEWRALICRASEHWPCFFRGVLSFRPHELERRHGKLWVRLRFRHHDEEPYRIFTAFRYHAPRHRCGCGCGCQPRACETPMPVPERHSKKR